jgi:outer membrane protein W
MNDRMGRVLGALVLMLGWSGGALSQSNSDPGVGLGAHASYTRAPDAAAGRLSGGIQLRARLTGGLGLEGLASYREEEYEIAGERVLKLAMVPVQGSVQVFFLFSKPIQPYVLAGIGYYYLRASGLGSRSDTGRTTENKFGAHAGAGIDARVARKVTVHADLRYVFIDVDAVRALTAPGPTEMSSNFWHGTAGISYHF